MSSCVLPTVRLGRLGRVVTRLGLGGEGVLRTVGRGPEADAVVREALGLGVTYFDSARAYAGSEGYYGRTWGMDAAARAGVFQTSKSAARDAAGAQRDLDTTLHEMKVSALDLWQIHDIRDEAELRAISRAGGALEAFLRAKEQGRARAIGVTGHHDPAVLLRAVRELPVDAVLLPVNVAEAALGGFLDRVVPAARERGVAVIGMKALGQGALLEAGFTADACLRFALAQDVDVVIVGCASPREVAANVASASSPAMAEEESAALVLRARRSARALAYYRGD